MPHFEVFERHSVPVSRVPMITVQRKGTLSLNAAAFEALESPEAVQLLYDPVERVIGFRKIDPSDPTAYRIRRQPNARSYVVAGQAFTQHYGINTDVARRYAAKMFDKVLGVDLKGESIEVRGPRLGTGKLKPTEPAPISAALS